MNDKIFLQLSAWRDPFVVNTVRSAYESAKLPELLTFGIVFDGYEEDRWMLDGLFDITPNIKLTWQDANTSSPYLCEARGNIAVQSLGDETYYMQTDAHTKFKQDWDVLLRAELMLANTHWGKSVITMLNTGFCKWSDPFIPGNFIGIPDEEFFKCMKVAVRGRLDTKENGLMVIDRFFNAGMFFAYSDFVRDVPQPSKFSFEMEQPIMGARCWTGGYNMVSATQAYCSNFDYGNNHVGETYDEFVRYSRSSDPRQQENFAKVSAESYELFKDVINNNIVDKDNGLLSERSLEDYIDFLGYHPVTLEVFKEVDIKAPGNWIHLPEESLQAYANIIYETLSSRHM